MTSLFMVTTKIIFPNMLKLYIIRLLFVYWPIFIKTLRLQMQGKWDITSDTKCYDVVIGTRIDVFRHSHIIHILHILYIMYYVFYIYIIFYFIYTLYVILYYTLYIIYFIYTLYIIYYTYIYNLKGLSMLIIFY